MAVKQYVEKPFKVMAEQFDGTAPPPTDHPVAGLCTCTLVPGLHGAPHVHTSTGVVPLVATDWIVQAQWSPHDWSVIPNAEFIDRFSGPPAEG